MHTILLTVSIFFLLSGGPDVGESSLGKLPGLTASAEAAPALLAMPDDAPLCDLATVWRPAALAGTCREACDEEVHRCVSTCNFTQPCKSDCIEEWQFCLAECP